MLRRHQSGQVSCARRRAHRITAHCPFEEHPRGGQTVDVRSANVLVAVASQRPRAVIVGQYEHDIGALGCRRKLTRHGKQHQRNGGTNYLSSHTSFHTQPAQDQPTPKPTIKLFLPALICSRRRNSSISMGIVAETVLP